MDVWPKTILDYIKTENLIGKYERDHNIIFNDIDIKEILRLYDAYFMKYYRHNLFSLIEKR